MAGMDITPEREKQVLFTTPYYDNSALFVGQQGKCRLHMRKNSPTRV